ncbi:tetratricopeptide repeat protein, partial [Streptomyces sp. V4-01]|nr:tetratricopeptide repeat protein [Streptomyces sp. V4-01]
RQAGRFGEAVADYTAALEVDPSLTWLLVERGEAHRQADQFGEAVADYTAALEVDPSLTWALVQRGQAHRHAGRFGEAVADYTAALEIDPSLTWLLVERGEAHRQADQFDEAIADYTAALQQDPTNAWMHYLLGLVLRGKGLGGEDEPWGRAVELLNRDAQNGPDAVHAHGNLLIVFCAMGDWRAASEQLEYFLAFAPAENRVREAMKDLEDLAGTLPIDADQLGQVRYRLQRTLDAP